MQDGRCPTPSEAPGAKATNPTSAVARRRSRQRRGAYYADEEPTRDHTESSDDGTGSEDESGSDDESEEENAGVVAGIFDDEARGDDDDDEEEEEPDDEDNEFIDDGYVEETGIRPADEDVFGPVEEVGNPPAAAGNGSGSDDEYENVPIGSAAFAPAARRAAALAQPGKDFTGRGDIQLRAFLLTGNKNGDGTKAELLRIHECLKKLPVVKKYVFSIERGPIIGNLHYQGVMVLVMVLAALYLLFLSVSRFMMGSPLGA